MITINARDLYQAFKQVKKSEICKGLPVLNYALMQLTDDGVVFKTIELTDGGKDVTASEPVHYWANGERWETCVIMVHVVETHPNGYRGVTSKRKLYPFLDYLRVMAEFGETLQISFDPNIQILTINSGNSKSEFKCLDALEFPPC